MRDHRAVEVVVQARLDILRRDAFHGGGGIDMDFQGIAGRHHAVIDRSGLNTGNLGDGIGDLAGDAGQHIRVFGAELDDDRLAAADCYATTAAMLRLADGQSYAATARRISMRERHVRKWAKRFLRDGPAGLYDAPRSGRPPVFSPRGGDSPGQNCLRIAG